MADTFATKADKLKEKQEECPHDTLLLVTTNGAFDGDFDHQICGACGKQTSVVHNCLMSWNTDLTILSCPYCGTDGT